LGVPDEGLDAAERGILLHRVLSLVWKRLKTHAQLMAMDETALSEFVGAMVHQAIDEAYATSMEMLTGRFAEIERGRLRRLVVEWLNYEREREPFEVLACEQASDVTVAGLAMHLRLDRLDRLADGTVALIDYKTGMARVTDWLGPRMDEPQLPLYCQASGQPISVLAFARVKRGARRKVFGFEGVSAVENLLPDVGPIESKSGMEKQGYVSWDILRAEWEDSINSLATNVINGDVEVDPKNGNLTCAQCDLQSVCRISELAGSSGFDDENAADGANAKAVDD
jgi:ATP-dependent helicase/DNAse subunit B